MARRRKNRKKMDGFVFPTSVATGIIMAAVLGLAYLWLCSTAEALGGQIKTLENDRASLREQYQNEQLRWTRLKSPRHIEATLVRYGIAMVWPHRDQIVTMNDLTLAELDRRGEGGAPMSPGQYASHGQTLRHE